MTLIAHGITGAFIATKITNPLLSFPIIIASHYLEDFIPHYDAGTGLSSGRKTKKTAFMLGLVDLFFMGLALLWFWQLANPQIAWLVYYGALVAILPDILHAPEVFLGFQPFFSKPFDQLHKLIHTSTNNKVIGIGTQVAVILAIYLLR